jgi:hypothetical protein
MPSSITALVTIRYQWVRVAGLERLLVHLADNRNPSLTGTLVLPATRYDTSDSSFVEIVFSSPELELEGTVFVPKVEVIAIVKTANPEDLGKVGYRGRAAAEANAAIESQPIPEAPVEITN